MIKINLSSSQKINIEKLHYEAIYNNLGKKKSITNMIKTTFNDKYTLKDFLIGDAKKLSDILQDFNLLTSSLKTTFKSHFDPYFLNQYKQRLSVTPKNKNSYSYDGEKYNAYILCQSLNIDVCPYCNKNYIFTIADMANNIFTRPTLDHFLDKATYPFLHYLYII